MCRHIGEITNSPWWECEVKKLFHRISTLVAKESTFSLAGQPTGISITGCRLLEPPFIISYGWNWRFLLPYPLEIGYDGGLMQTACTDIYPLPTPSTQLWLAHKCSQPRNSGLDQSIIMKRKVVFYPRRQHMSIKCMRELLLKTSSTIFCLPYELLQS